MLGAENSVFWHVQVPGSTLKLSDFCFSTLPKKQKILFWPCCLCVFQHGGLHSKVFPVVISSSFKAPLMSDTTTKRITKWCWACQQGWGLEEASIAPYRMLSLNSLSALICYFLCFVEWQGHTCIPMQRMLENSWPQTRVHCDTQHSWQAVFVLFLRVGEGTSNLW